MVVASLHFLDWKKWGRRAVFALLFGYLKHPSVPNGSVAEIRAGLQNKGCLNHRLETVSTSDKL